MVAVTIGANTTNNLSGVLATRIVQQAPVGNYSDGQYIEVSKWQQGSDETHSIIELDLSQIPAGSTFNTFTIHLFRESGSNHTYTVDIRGIIAAVNVTELTWNERSTGVNWGTAGGIGDGVDRQAAIAGTISIDPTNGYKVSTNIAALAQASLASGKLIVHLERNGTGNDQYHRFTGTGGTDGQRIFATADYTPPASASVTVPVSSARYGDTVSYSSSGLNARTSWAIEDSEGNIIPITGDQNSFTIGNLVKGATRPISGPVYLQVGDGTTTVRTASTFTLNPPANYSEVRLAAGFDTSVDSYLNGYTGTVAVNTPIWWPTAQGTLLDNGDFILNAPGTMEFFGGELTTGLIDSANLIWRDVTGPVAAIAEVVNITQKIAVHSSSVSAIPSIDSVADSAKNNVTQIEAVAGIAISVSKTLSTTTSVNAVAAIGNVTDATGEASATSSVAAVASISQTTTKTIFNPVSLTAIAEQGCVVSKEASFSATLIAIGSITYFNEYNAFPEVRPDSIIFD